jgi:hypothetical protein
LHHLAHHIVVCRTLDLLVTIIAAAILSISVLVTSSRGAMLVVFIVPLFFLGLAVATTPALLIFVSQSILLTLTLIVVVFVPVFAVTPISLAILVARPITMPVFVTPVLASRPRF